MCEGVNTHLLASLLLPLRFSSPKDSTHEGAEELLLHDYQYHLKHDERSRSQWWSEPLWTATLQILRAIKMN